MFALLSCTRLRVSEAIQLRYKDITSDGLLICQTKFQKSQLVPLHETLALASSAICNSVDPTPLSTTYIHLAARKPR